MRSLIEWLFGPPAPTTVERMVEEAMKNAVDNPQDKEPLVIRPASGFRVGDSLYATEREAKIAIFGRLFRARMQSIYMTMTLGHIMEEKTLTKVLEALEEAGLVKRLDHDKE